MVQEARFQSAPTKMCEWNGSGSTFKARLPGYTNGMVQEALSKHAYRALRGVSVNNSE